MNTLDLVFHDWMNLTPEERKLAIRDIQALAEDAGTNFESRTIPHPDVPVTPQRRARSINIIASFFHFLSEARGEKKDPG
jgi:hypothetical protein